MVSYGRRLREARNRAGLSQLRLAEISGVGKRTIQDLEAEKHAPQRSTRIKLGQVLEIEGPDNVEESFAEFSAPVRDYLLIIGAFLEDLDEAGRTAWLRSFLRPGGEG